MIATTTSFEERIREEQDSVKIKEQENNDILNVKKTLFNEANLRYLLPEVKFEDYESAYIKIRQSQVLAAFEARNPKYAHDILDVEGEEVIDYSNQHIFCAYHYGSFHAIISLLIRRNVDFALLIDNSTYEAHYESSIQQINNIKRYYNVNCQFELLNAEKFDIIESLIQSVNSGKSIIAYLDGNTGTGGSFRKDERMVKVRFLERYIYARRGIAFLAAQTQLPIIPVVSGRNNERIKVELYDSINIEVEQNKFDFADQTTQQLFNILEKHVLEDPLQWECWPYVHKWIDVKGLPVTSDSKDIDYATEDNFSFNQERYGIFKLSGEYYLLDKAAYITLKINEFLSDLLQNINRFPNAADLQEKGIRKGLMQKLLGKQILLKY